MAFTSAATVVVANQFTLLDPNGIIVANLSNGTGGGFPFGGAFSQLEMLHNDPNTTDSSLGWTQSGASGTEIVRLEGPSTVGAGLQGRPRLLLYRQNPGIPFTGVVIDSGRPDGAIQPTSYIELDQGDAGAGSMILSSDTQATVQASSGGRGLMYGTSFHTALLGVNVNSGAGVPTVVLTINLPNAPVVGAEAHVSWSAAMQNIFGAGTGVVMTVAIDGVQQAPFGQIQADVLNNIHTISGVVLAAVGVGAHTVTLRSTATGAANSWTLQAGGVVLEIVYYR